MKKILILLLILSSFKGFSQVLIDDNADSNVIYGLWDVHVFDNRISWVSDESPVTVQKLINNNWVDVYASFYLSDEFEVTQSGYYIVTTPGSESKIYYIKNIIKKTIVLNK